MILDGFGEGKDYAGNAIAHAKMPNLTRLKKEYPHTLLQASGNEVGLPANTAGNSEVGHFTIGAGRIVYQSLEQINRSIKDDSFAQKPALLKAIQTVNSGNKAALHLIGLISDAGVHSHLNHLFSLLELAAKHNVNKIFIHVITDGRDVEERSAKKYLEQIQKKIQELNLEQPPQTDPTQHPSAEIATIIGRYYAMDRDNNWDRTQEAYDLLTLGKGTQEKDPLKAIDHTYAQGAETDYYIPPIILNENGLIKDKDAVIFFNYRTDRPRQLTYCFTQEKKIGFTPQKQVHPFFTVFGDYSTRAPVIFPPELVNNNLAQTLAQNNLKQLRLAETEKYAHVTYFLNNQVEKPVPHEERIMVDSPKVQSYDEKPEMSAHELTDLAVQKISTQEYDFIAQNFANTDLVGHSGKYEATVKACEIVDECIGRIAAACEKNNYTLIITADHGNAEYMIYEETGNPCPSHTQNPVPCIIMTKNPKNGTLPKGKGLKDIAPTILHLLKVPKPKEMAGESLL